MKDRVSQVADDVFLWRWGVENVYIIRSGRSGVIVDTALPGLGKQIRAAAERILEGRPAAILLTHGHLDHAGSAAALSAAWSIPVYVHKNELPFVRGDEQYPPAVMPDPPPRGFMRPFVPHALPHWLEVRLGRRMVAVETLGRIATGFDEDTGVPGLADWCAVPTPGHSPGHVTFFRERGRVLLSGDALLTVDADSVRGLLSMRRQLARPPSPATSDWVQAWNSIAKLAKLAPSVIGAGHGLPMSEPDIAEKLRVFARAHTAATSCNPAALAAC
jgi:glyoxylase-like metal-dependent hydrolase (beta-lactamase superfamily II)